MIGPVLAIALSTLASEDLACIAAGALVARNQLSFSTAVLACFAGIVAGDIGLLLAGRIAGRTALQWRLLRRVTPQALERAASWIEQRGGYVVLLSRFSPGLRVPTYIAAGLTKTPLWKWIVWFAFACAIWAPLVVGVSALLGAAALTRIRAFIIVAVICWAALKFREYAFRRRVLAFFHRKFRWEFWPVWAAYAPLAPYLLYLALRHRSLTLFTAANPGIPTGGLTGESKWEILRHLSHARDYVARSELLNASVSYKFPIVLKPDIGERGRGVLIARSPEDVRRYAISAPGATIVQEYVPGIEFGIFYYRYPDQRQGQIVSITEKRLPEIYGDGRRSIRELILGDPRAFCIADVYLRNITRDPESVPAKGECVRLAEIGSHCRGAIFLDATHLNTRALENTFDDIAKTHPGFFIGRFDVRAESIDALQRGRGFKVLELNGVGGEAAHIYDPAVSLREAYRVLAWQWRTAFEIAAINRDRGAKPMGVLELVRWIINRRLRNETSANATLTMPPTDHQPQTKSAEVSICP